MTLLLLHSTATLFMTGLIWFVQVVHYPLLRRVSGGGFIRYEQEHKQRTSPVVAPVMLFELGTGIWLALAPPAVVEPVWFYANAALLAVIWASTFGLQVPAHDRLTEGFDGAVVDRLVHTNWLRTGAWSARAILLTVVLLALLESGPGAPAMTAGSP